jgi:replicative DNA helicase
MLLTQEFRLLILKCLVHDYNFCQRFIDYLKKEYFETIPEQVIFDKLHKFFIEYHKIPAKAEMFQLCVDFIDDALVIKVIKNIYKEKIVNLDYVTNTLKEFCLHQELKQSIIYSHNELLPKGQYDAIFDSVKKAISTVDKFDDFGTNYVSNIDKRISNRNLSELENKFIHTGIGNLDYFIRGLKPPQVGVLMAPPKKGKSMFLVNVAANALFYRKKVIYYTFELIEDDICDRLDACLTRIPINNLKGADSNIKARLNTIQMLKGNIIIKYYPTRKATVNTLMAHIEKLANGNNFKPDLIVIDYPSRMKSMSLRKERRIEIEDIYLDIIGMAGELNVPIWVAHQTDRESITSEQIGMENVSESMEPVRGCDVILTLNFNNIEKEAKLGRINIAGNRNGRDGIEVKIKKINECMKIDSIEHEEYKKELSKIKLHKKGEDK